MLTRRHTTHDAPCTRYILTLDYCIKLIEIEERRQAVVPTIIVGETGVGKSECLRIYSMLVNEGHTLSIGHDVAQFVTAFCDQHQRAIPVPVQPMPCVASGHEVGAAQDTDDVVKARYVSRRAPWAADCL